MPSDRTDSTIGPRRDRRRAFTLVELLVAITVVAVLVSLILPALSGAREAGRRTVCASNLRQLVIADDLYADSHADGFAPGASDFLANLDRWHGRRQRPTDAFAPGGGALTPYLDGGPAEASVRACPAFDDLLKALARTGAGFERGCGGYGYNAAFVGTRRTRDGRAVTDRLGQRRSALDTPDRTLAFADAALATGQRPTGVIEYSFVEPPFQPGRPARRLDPSMHFRHDDRAGVAWLDGHVTAEPFGSSWSSGIYPADPEPHRIGWPAGWTGNGRFSGR